MDPPSDQSFILHNIKHLDSVPVITGIGSLSPLLGVKIVHLVDRSDLFKISNLVYDGREIVRSLYSSLQGQSVYGGYSELAGSLLVSVKTDGLGNFLEKLML